jgi:hypothetical protein
MRHKQVGFSDFADYTEDHQKRKPKQLEIAACYGTRESVTQGAELCKGVKTTKEKPCRPACLVECEAYSSGVALENDTVKIRLPCEIPKEREAYFTGVPKNRKSTFDNVPKTPTRGLQKSWKIWIP